MDIVMSPCESFDFRIESWRASTIAFWAMIRPVLFATLGLLAALPAAAAELRVVAYVIGWQTPPGIDPTKLTHINFAFARIEDGKAVLPHPGVAANLAHLRSLKAKNPRLKVLLSVGG